ncbi:hypothetical protein DFH06DRAFT_1012334 [Mycena polygramma]|nr:hypothetical protein DFH06DRAFT_1012334 [Mycena polygramma]
MRLRGIIYGGGSHFTCRFIEQNGDMWYHDGITTGRRCVRHGNMSVFQGPLDLQKCRGSNAVALIYALEM